MNTNQTAAPTADQVAEIAATLSYHSETTVTYGWLGTMTNLETGATWGLAKTGAWATPEEAEEFRPEDKEDKGYLFSYHLVRQTRTTASDVSVPA